MQIVVNGRHYTTLQLCNVSSCFLLLKDHRLNLRTLLPLGGHGVLYSQLIGKSLFALDCVVGLGGLEHTAER
jgi:hypothetical protein